MKKRPNEADLAWDLVDEHRAAMTQAERDMAFVNLGVGEFTIVIRDVLSAVLREKQSLSPAYAAEVEAWIDCYAQHAGFRVLLNNA
jgi:hypothetical protein